MRAVQNQQLSVSDDVLDAFSTCVLCRGCEPACPSDVPFGSMMEQTRTAIQEQVKATKSWQRLLLAVLSWPAGLRLASSLLGLAQRAQLVPRSLPLPSRLPITRTRLEPSGEDVYLFTGCVMDAWQRETHKAVMNVIESLGVGVTPTGDEVPCCGALHTHAGLRSQAKKLAVRTIDRLQDHPILVDSAGCGAAMKEYGDLVGTDEAHEFSSRVFDIHEWLEDKVNQLPTVDPLPVRVAIQDPCHLRHVQRAHGSTRAVLKPFVTELVEIDDDGLCCGAGGMYSMTQPELAAELRARKVAAIRALEVDVVASANPGCSMFLSVDGLTVVHPLELIDRALEPYRLDSS